MNIDGDVTEKILALRERLFKSGMADDVLERNGELYHEIVRRYQRFVLRAGIRRMNLTKGELKND